MQIEDISALELAQLFHEKYERLAPEFGYETRKESREFDPNSPNGKLMIAVCQQVLNEFVAPVRVELVSPTHKEAWQAIKKEIDQLQMLVGGIK